jgi:hypothetical protein
MRHNLTVAIAAAVTATSVSFAVAQATNPPARTAATDKAAVRQLKALNRTTDKVRNELNELRGDTGRFCRAIATESYSCPTAFPSAARR